MYAWVGAKHEQNGVVLDEAAEKDLKENRSLFMFGNNQYLAIGGGGYVWEENELSGHDICNHLNNTYHRDSFIQCQLWTEP